VTASDNMQPARAHGIETSEVTLTVDGAVLNGELAVPCDPAGIVVFPYCGESRRSRAHDHAVAQALAHDGFATLQFDLLTGDELRDRTAHVDLQVLARRLVGAVEWVSGREHLEMLPVGLFGASTGAAAALIAATRIDIGAVVSRGGRCDLATAVLPDVQSPTLLVVGGADVEVIDMNRRALRAMCGPATLHIVPHAGHRFEEPGALDEVRRVASEWFLKHLATSRWLRKRAEARLDEL
jgi:dienelactone hydrolase